MQINQTNQGAVKRHPVFGYAAFDGVYAGIYCLVIILSAAYSATVPFLGLAAMVLMAAAPFATYALLRARSAGRPSERRVSTVWIEGVYTYLFGALLMALGIYVWLRVFDPGFMQRQLTAVLELTASNPGTAELNQALESSIRQNGIPPAIQVAISLAWPVVLLGSFVSLAVALIMKVSGGRKLPATR